jgi:uncharacterized protein YjbI with pentapeptide repeats
MANKDHLDVLMRGVESWNAWRFERPMELPGFRGADLNAADLRGANLNAADLGWADLRRAQLAGANLWRADLRWAQLAGADLNAADLGGANLWRADLRGANLSNARLNDTDLGAADLGGANLCSAILRGANLSGSDLAGADLGAADLSRATLLETKIEKANLTGCRIHGVSVWDVVLDAETRQHDLVITPNDEPSIMVDDLEVAQFIHLLLNNEKIRRVIDTITSTVVLILGITVERKAVLAALRDDLRKRGRLPVVYDFDLPATRDTQDKITTLARMARFVIADLTAPTAIPQEWAAIVAQLPSVAVQPILQEGCEPSGMQERILRHSWVLPIRRYTTQEAFLARLGDLVITPAEGKAREIRQGK